MTPSKQKKNSNWQFSLKIILPILIISFVVIATIIGFMAWTVSRNDEASISHQARLLTHSIKEQRELISREQKSVATWDKALQTIQESKNHEWIESNLGIAMFDFFGHDRVIILNPELQPIYAMENGKSVNNNSYETIRSTIEPIARRLREINWQGALSSFTYGHSDKIPNIVDIALINNQPAIISLMPIASNAKVGNQNAGKEFTHVSIEYLDHNMAAELADLLLLKNPMFSQKVNQQNNIASITIKNNAGTPITYFLWEPIRPGAQMLSETKPIIAFATLFVIIIITLLILRLKNSTSSLEAEKAAAHHLAYHDKLTGLGNRALFEKSLSEAIIRTSSENSKLAMLILDLDMFKQVNDTLGHQAGDELICEVAKRLQPLVRTSDVITRLGGDEFAIIATEFSCTKDIKTMCNRMVKSIRQPFELKAGQAFVGVSIGVSVCENKKDNAEELVRKADIALYEAKNGGRNQFKLFEDKMGETVQRRQKIETDLRQALIADDQISVIFDPLVRHDNVELLGYEAKIVWEHPLLGKVPSQTFIPVAEYCGLISTIGNILLRKACEKGAKEPGRFIALRAFPNQLRRHDYFKEVIDVVKETGINPNDLELEINENMLNEEEKTATSNIHKFREAGIKIAISDFGSGFTSLRLAQEFQVDRIKICRSFITEMEQSPDPEAITHAVVWLARAVGVEVSADGIDSITQKEFLYRMGCMSFQGKLFSNSNQKKWQTLANKNNNIAKAANTQNDDDIEVWG